MGKTISFKEIKTVANTIASKYEIDLGKPDKVIDTVYNTERDIYSQVGHYLPQDALCDFYNQVRLYVKSKTLIIIERDNTYVIPFSKILGFELHDNCRNEVTQSINTVTTTDTGNLVKRAVVGGLLGGAAGAVIGGATATRYTSSDVDRFAEAYQVLQNLERFELAIKVEDILSPLIKIPFGQFVGNAEELCASLEVIIKNNADTPVEVDSKEIIKQEGRFILKAKEMGFELQDPYEEYEDYDDEENIMDSLLHSEIFWIIVAIIAFIFMVIQCT